jgi:hypothetical protein
VAGAERPRPQRPRNTEKAALVRGLSAFAAGVDVGLRWGGSGHGPGPHSRLLARHRGPLRHNLTPFNYGTAVFHDDFPHSGCTTSCALMGRGRKHRPRDWLRMRTDCIGGGPRASRRGGRGRGNGRAPATRVPQRG